MTTFLDWRNEVDSYERSRLDRMQLVQTFVSKQKNALKGCCEVCQWKPRHLVQHYVDGHLLRVCSPCRQFLASKLFLGKSQIEPILQRYGITKSLLFPQFAPYCQPMVYIATTGNGKKVKIGISNNVRGRMGYLKADYTQTIKLIRCFPGTDLFETQLQHRFHESKSNAPYSQFGKEWFQPNPEMREFINVLRSIK